MHDKGVTVVIVTGGAGSPARMGVDKTSKKKVCPCMISIPLKALAGGDDNGKDMTPESGDTVTLENVMGVVKSIEGDMAHVEIQSVNGEEATYVGGDGGDSDGDRDKMIDMAKSVDDEAGYVE